MNKLRVLLMLMICLSLGTRAQTTLPSSKFKEGHYYRKDGTKVSGLLKLSYGGNLFTNKSDGDCSVIYRAGKGEKKIDLTTNDICCFVIEKDSFAIIKNYRMHSMVTYPQDFAKVLLIGSINLYMYYTTIADQYGQSTVANWVIEKDGQAYTLTKKEFKKLSETHLKNCPELLSKMNNDKLDYDDVMEIIRTYNDYMRKSG